MTSLQPQTFFPYGIKCEFFPVETALCLIRIQVAVAVTTMPLSNQRDTLVCVLVYNIHAYSDQDYWSQSFHSSHQNLLFWYINNGQQV